MRSLRFRFIIGALACALLTILPGAPAHAKWLVAHSPTFIVYSDGGEKELRGFVEDLEKYDALLRKMTGTDSAPAPRRLTIYLANSAKMYKTINPLIADQTRGFYSSSPREIMAVARIVPSEGAWLSARTVIFHEYTHHFLAQYFPAAYPRWFNEGFAEYYSTAVFKPDAVEVGQASLGRAYGLVSGSWKPIQTIFAPFAENAKPEDMEIFYAQSWLTTHYLLRSPERTPHLQEYLRALRRGEESATAFTTALNTDFDTFDKELRDYLKKGMTYSKISWKPPAPGAITITPLPASADALLPLRARILVGAVDGDARKDFIDAVKQEAAAFPDDRLALQTLANAEIFYGEPAQAAPYLDKLLQLHPDDPEGLYLKGTLTMIQAWTAPARASAEIAKARPLFAKAYRLDPTHYQALYSYGRTFLSEPGRPSENTLNVLMRARELAPQVDEIAFTAGRALLDAGETAQAKPLLESVAYNPHPTALARAALTALHRDSANLDKAIGDFTNALKGAPDNPTLLARRAEAYVRTGQRDLALQDFAAIRRVSAKNAIGMNNLCWIQATNNFALDDALKDCDASLAIEPASSPTLDSRGFVNLRLGRLTEALADYDAALALRPRAPSSLFGRSLVKRALGRTQEATADRETALALDPTVAAEFEGYGLK